MFRSLLLTMALLGPGTAAFAAGEAVTLYKTPNCTCCEAYADYLRDNGFEVEVVPTHDLSGLKAEQGVPGPLGGCHTSLIAGYTFEGHIPVDSIRRVLAEEPDITGISVPGMPTGSPGMTGMLRGPMQVWTIPSAQGERPQPYATYEDASEWR